MRNDLIPDSIGPQGGEYALDYRKLNEAYTKGHFHCPSRINYARKTRRKFKYIVSPSMAFGLFSDFPLTDRTKKRQPSTCPYGIVLPMSHAFCAYAMNPARFNDGLEKPSSQDKLEEQEITETFPLETIGSVALRCFDPAGVVHDKEALDILEVATIDPPRGHLGAISPPKSNSMGQFHIFKRRKQIILVAVRLPVKIWGLKAKRLHHQLRTRPRKVQLNELSELAGSAYENSLIYKEKTKRIHDAKIKNRGFNVGDQVLLFNSKLKIFSGKLKSCWSGPFTIVQVFPYGTVELFQNFGPNFKVNGHRLKHYFVGDVPAMDIPDLQTFPEDN
ncbi:hypothetical protein Tco_0774287 [Tanacetum coccineum]|uniref:Reverse transcriptase domain-containing protein n=1 Tax=Tanacetum coccineum TaxID=301880 RepID=A0ABQ4ZQN1_9ASTR